MPDPAMRYDSMLFNYETTARTDYKINKFEAPVKTHAPDKKTRLRRDYKSIKDTSTLVEVKGRMPFNLFWLSPKDILGTDPRNVQQPCYKFVDKARKEAQRTRPRHIMTPQVSMDDIEEDDVRDIVTNDIYRTSTQIALEEGVALTKNYNVRAPFYGHNAPANPVFLPVVKPPLVPPEWRRDTVTWDNQQLRTFCEPEREFWRRRGSLYKDCVSCKETAQVANMRKMKQNMPHN